MALTNVKKIILIILLVLIAGLVGGSWYFWTYHFDPFVQEGRARRAEAKEFGGTSDEEACLARAMEDFGEQPGFEEAILARVFLSECLEFSSPAEGFCDDVPPSSEIVSSAQWRLTFCAQEGHSDNHCQQILAAVQEHCDRSRSGDPAENDEGIVDDTGAGG